MRPNRSTAARAAASASPRFVTSSLTTSRSSAFPTAFATASVSRPVATTAWPAARAALTKSTPMPRPAPVMNQIFLFVMVSHSLLIGSQTLLRSSFVASVADLLHPVHGLATELFLNGDVRHGSGHRGAVPMLLTRRNPDHVTGPNLLERPSPAPREAAANRHDQGLAQRVRVHAVRAPGSNVTLAPSTRAGLGASNRGSIRTVPVNHSAGPLPEGCEPLRLMSIWPIVTGPCAPE